MRIREIFGPVRIFGPLCVVPSTFMMVQHMEWERMHWSGLEEVHRIHDGRHSESMTSQVPPHEVELLLHCGYLS